MLFEPSSSVPVNSQLQAPDQVHSSSSSISKGINKPAGDLDGA